MDIVRGVVLLATIVGAAAGCKSKASRGELTPPKDAAPWEEQRYGVSFDDDYTAADLELQGRAPNSR